MRAHSPPVWPCEPLCAVFPGTSDRARADAGIFMVFPNRVKISGAIIAELAALRNIQMRAKKTY